MATVRVAWVVPAEFVAVTGTETVPAAVGVPLMMPWAALKVSPAGRAPAV